MKKKYYTSFDSAYLYSKNDIIEYNGSVYEVISKNNYGYNTSQYYSYNNFQEESEDQKSIRLAKEKAEKRNRTIDQILG
jgi:hypothetical protein